MYFSFEPDEVEADGDGQTNQEYIVNIVEVKEQNNNEYVIRHVHTELI